MTLEEWFVACHVLNSHNTCCTKFYHLVNQLHWIAVGEKFADAVDIHYRSLIWIVDGSLNLVLADFTAHLTCKLIVDGMSRTSGDDTALDGFADKSHVANDVEELVACALILPYKRLVLDITEIVGVAVLHLDHVGQLVELLL